jgi:hypothetical protein
MHFNPIDFNVYNKPPYYPQTYARGETKKLVSFDDEQFAELDRLIDKMSDQYDLEKAKGILLDRLGKLVDENRDGNDDELYRLLIRLRILLNTTDGSINDIIKVIKFIFSSEVVHIQPNYPAGISILHDGESPAVNFNKYIAQVVAAGVAFDTKELFYFTENIDVSEKVKIAAEYLSREEFFGQIKHNGRIARDGHTIRDVEFFAFQHNGKKKRDGTTQRKRIYWKPSISNIQPPFRHSSGAQDTLAITIEQHGLTDKYHGQVYRKEYFKRDKTIKHNSVNPFAASEVVSVIFGQMDMVDEMPPCNDQQNIKVVADMTEDMNKFVRRNKMIKRNRKHVHSNFPAEQNSTQGIFEPVIEEYGAVNEMFLIWIRYHHFHNRFYRRNRNIKHNGNILIPLE